MSKKETKTPAWLMILLALIPVLGVIIVGYWQFVYKPSQQEQVKTIPYTGRVRDDQTNQPVVKAKVSIEEDQKVPQVQETDSDGIFHVYLPESVKEVRILVDAGGYKPLDRRVSLTRTGIEDIRLQPNATAPPAAVPSPSQKTGPSGPGRAKTNPRKRVRDGNCNSEDILLGRC